MLPTLVPGKIIIALRTKRISTGDIIILRHNDLEKIKRVSNSRDGQIFIVGDNPVHSTDSRDFGWVGTGDVLGKIFWPRV